MRRHIIIAAIAATLLIPTAIAIAEDIPVIEISVEVAPTPTPPPAPYRPTAYAEYEWTRDTIDAVASVYWAECNTVGEKLAVTKLLHNRADHGSPFKDSIEACAKQGNEFHRGHISTNNRELAVVLLNRVQTQIDGDWAGISVPDSAVYMDRVDGVLTMYDINWTEVWRDE